MGQIILISLLEYIINNISETEIYKEQVENQKVNVLTKEEFDGITKSYETNCQLLRITDLDDSSSINIYLKNFNSKEQVISLIEQV